MNIFMANPTVTVGLISFISAQIIKTALFAIKQKTFNPERITGAGGMPSSHSALVVSRCAVSAAAGGIFKLHVCAFDNRNGHCYL